MQLERLRALDAHVFLEPLLVTVQLRGRCTRPVGHQREQCPLNVETEAALARLRTHDRVDAEPPPHRFERINVAIRPRAHQPPLRGVCDDLVGRAAAQDALREPPQSLDDLRIVGTAAVVDDARLRASLGRIPHVLGQLQVHDFAPVGPLRFAFAHVHAHDNSIRDENSTIHVSGILAGHGPEARAVVGGRSEM